MRNAQKQDAPLIAALEKECIACPWPLSEIEKAIEDPQYIFLVAPFGKTLSGYGSLRVTLQEAEINNIAVAKPFRRRGIAENILKSLILDAREAFGAETFFLEVARGNTAAIKLYEKNGFIRIALRKRYYPDGQDALIYKLSL